MKLFLIFIFQIIFNILKTLEIRFTYENRVGPLMVNSVFINLVSLVTFYFSLTELLNENFTVVFFYIAGSVIGKWIAMTKLENLRHKIYMKWKVIKGSRNRHQ